MLKLFASRMFSLVRAGLIALVVLFAVASVGGCATVKHTAGVVAQQGIDCAKAEIIGQVPNLIAGVNTILANPSTLQATKEAEIIALTKSSEELMACLLRQVIGDIRDAAVNGQLDSDTALMKQAAAAIVQSRGYTYADGWEQLSP